MSDDSKVPTARDLAHEATACSGGELGAGGYWKPHSLSCNGCTEAIERDRTATIEACARLVDAEATRLWKAAEMYRVSEQFGEDVAVRIEAQAMDVEALAARIRALSGATRKEPTT